MKKRAIVLFGIIVIVILGILIGKRVVSANTPKNDPRISISVINKEGIVINEKEVLGGTEFELSLKFDGGGVNTKGSPASISLDNIKLDLTELESENIEIKDVTFKYRERDVANTEKEMNLDIVDGEVNIGPLIYHYNAAIPSNEREDNTWGPIGEIKLTLQANTNTNIDLTNKIKVKYNTLKVLDDLIVSAMISNGEFEVIIREGVYTNGSISSGMPPQQAVALNKYFDLSYTINPGTLALNTNNLTSDGVQNINEIKFEERSLIYLIDEAVVDLNGGNNELARDSIKKSLLEFKKNNPNTEVSLVTYGENAEIVKVNDKSIFSIDELIVEIDKIKATDISGNLGDGIRKVQYLINEEINSNASASVIMVSAGNPNYYTQISEGNSEMLKSRVDKEGKFINNREKAEAYVNEVVNDIIINEDDDTRWYGINYGMGNNENILRDLIEKFEGDIPNINRPYYDDFIILTEKAMMPIDLNATLSVVPKEGANIEVHSEDINKKITLNFKNNNGIITAPEPLNQNIRVKVTALNETNETINMAAKEKLEVKLIVNFNGENIETEIFNKDNSINWPVRVEVPYIAKVGLFNGRFDLNNISGRDIESHIDDVNLVASQVLQEIPSVDLAIENYFAFGMVIRGDRPLIIEGIERDGLNTCRTECQKCKHNKDDPDYCKEKCVYCYMCKIGCKKCDKNNGAGKCFVQCKECEEYRKSLLSAVFDVYTLDESDKTFKPAVEDENSNNNGNGGNNGNNATLGFDLQANKTHLVVMKKYVDIDKLGKTYDVGVTVREGIGTNKSPNNNNETELESEFWSIKVTGVNKPEHF